MEITEVWGCLLHQTLQYMGMMKGDQLKAEEENRRRKRKKKRKKGINRSSDQLV